MDIIYMADGNFITNQKLPGKKSGSEHDDRNDNDTMTMTMLDVGRS
jgi:hypothetical protein